MNRLKGAVLGLAFMALPAIAQAQLINFDDLSACGGVQLSNGYQGFNWNNFWALNTTNVCYPYVSGYAPGTVSAPNVAYNGGGTLASVSRANPFTFNSVYMTAAWRNGLFVTVYAYDALNNLIDNGSFFLNITGPTNEVFNWAGVSSVRFSASGGTNPGGLSGDGTQIAFDNMLMNNATVTPEPATLVLLATGLAGIGGIVRRRRQKNS